MKRKNARKNMALWMPVNKNKIRVVELKSKKKITTFQRALRVTIILGQAFSLMPVLGVTSYDTSNVKFVKTSWKCLYAFLSLIGQIFMVMLCINRLAHSNGNVSMNATSSIIFYVTTCVTMVLFMQVARRWPALAQHIARTEEADPHFNTSLTYKCNITCAVLLILALSEHILSLLSAFAGAMASVNNKITYEGFITHLYPWIFNFLPYTPTLGVLIQFLHFQSTFVWNFSDLFVICMSYYLISRLEQVNKKLLAAQGKYLPEIFWRATREDYCRVTQLVRKVDDVISGIVFISFANNLFFICIQLFNILETGLLGSNESVTYFVFSLVYLMSRSVAISVIASQVNIATSVPAPVLYDVPSPVYCVEVQRFLDQVNGDKVALSGLQFFSVTRGLLLTVAGTIVTYELVMFQFKTSSPSLQNTTSYPSVSTASRNVTFS